MNLYLPRIADFIGIFFCFWTQVTFEPPWTEPFFDSQERKLGKPQHMTWFIALWTSPPPGVPSPLQANFWAATGLAEPPSTPTSLADNSWSYCLHLLLPSYLSTSCPFSLPPLPLPIQPLHDNFTTLMTQQTNCVLSKYGNLNPSWFAVCTVADLISQQSGCGLKGFDKTQLKLQGVSSGLYGVFFWRECRDVEISFKNLTKGGML